MRTAALVYPHQLFADHPAVAGADAVVLVEDPLFFTQYRFHRQKLILHRASMKRYAAGLRTAGARVHYIEAAELSDSGAVAARLASWKVQAASPVYMDEERRNPLSAYGLPMAIGATRVSANPEPSE